MEPNKERNRVQILSKIIDDEEFWRQWNREAEDNKEFEERCREVDYEDSDTMTECQEKV